MANLSTVYMGMKLKSPFIVGSCSLTSDMDSLRKAETAGAGAVVIKSLFEEQLQAEAVRLENALSAYENMIAEALSFHPAYAHAGPSEHLHWIEKARKELSIPIIASLNAVSPGRWTDYATQLVDAGADALELNFFGIITDPQVSGQDALRAMIATAREIKTKVTVPVAVKLTPFILSPGYVVAGLDATGVDGLVLFNRFARFDIDIATESVRYQMALTSSRDMEHSLRWVSLLHDRTQADICGSSGIHTLDDVIKMILAGAGSVQLVSALYQHGMNYLSDLHTGLDEWMNRKGYDSIQDFQGRVSRSRSGQPFVFERHQYIKALLGIQ
ncbi:dihydroorotate dehydrogenase-like protein [bacterium]|nr:dihydroorotate dehydrogenase-like protein [candidate division CSSED10-310 bacterium]